MTTETNPIGMTADIVAAFVSHNSLPRNEISLLFETVHSAISKLVVGGTETAAKAVDILVPAVSVRKSVYPDYIICLEDGKRFKSLKRHLTKLNMTPHEYRVKWNLPETYPMVAAEYAAARSALAKKIGLGSYRKNADAAVNEKAPRAKGQRRVPKGNAA